jgi:hypothetical protein
MHSVRASTWGTRSLWYRESFRGTGFASKPNRKSEERNRGPMAEILLAVRALTGDECCCASWAQAWRGGIMANGVHHDDHKSRL